MARERMRTRHLALRTEQAYLQWLQRYVDFHDGRDPHELAASEVERFLTHLAVHRKGSAATQNQALQALLFLYRHVLVIELPWLDGITRAAPERKLLVVLSPRGGACAPRTAARHGVAGGEFALWERVAADGSDAVAGKGPRARARRGHRARGQGWQGPGHDAARGAQQLARRASRSTARVV